MSFLVFDTYIYSGDYMLIRIKKIQFMCGLCLLMQVMLARYLIPFHLLATLLSVAIIFRKRRFRVLQIQYHYYIIALYTYRLWLFTIPGLYILYLLYLISCLYIAIIILLCSFRAIL